MVAYIYNISVVARALEVLLLCDDCSSCGRSTGIDAECLYDMLVLRVSLFLGLPADAYI